MAWEWMKRMGWRDWLAGIVLPLVLGWISGVAQASPVTVNAARIWPASEYTRITLESSGPIKYSQALVKDPDRLVLDLEGVEPNAILSSLTARLGAEDPYIRQIRVGRFKAGVVRVVFDLKTEIKPSIFSLSPVGEYGDRLVVDVYASRGTDPLLALSERVESGRSHEPEASIAESDPAEAAKGPSGAESARSTERRAADRAGAEKNAAERPTGDKAVVERASPDSAGADKGSGDKAAKNDKHKNGFQVTRLVTIAIDAGHGGEDPGAAGKRGTHEKDVTLAIARRLKQVVERETNLRGVLIRDGDYFIPLQERVVKARKANADLFVSIHADAFIRPDARGSSVFALSERGATSAAARWLAKRENDADLIGGVNIDVKDPYLARTLLDLSQTATINDSLKLAKAVLSELSEVNSLHRGAVEQAGFAVLKSPDIPSILVETAFISNPEEEKRLTDEDYQDKLANAILSGIRRYLAKNPPLAKSRLAQAGD